MLDRLWISSRREKNPEVLIAIYKKPTMRGAVYLFFGCVVMLVVSLLALPVSRHNRETLEINTLLILVSVCAVVISYTICIQIRSPEG